MYYESHIMPNGLRIIHLPSNSPVSYCGFAINVGTRDEKPHEFGLAHFLEHMLFKGTKRRKAWHILNRMESVGGELNAYTTKEETFAYSVFLSEDFDRAVELLSDLVFNSQFPESEIEKERDVILDEINSYKDNPSELIFDEFEDLLFAGHEIGHNILGEAKILETFNHSTCTAFYRKYYVPSNMIFFSMGKTPFSKVVRLISKYAASEKQESKNILEREAPNVISSHHDKISKSLHQTHVIIGARAYNIHEENRIGLYLLNNILGGPGMNSRLNLSLREKNGLVYSVESGLTSYTDTGIFSIYFGCDHKYADKCLSLTHKELKRLRDEKLSGSQLSAAKKQLKGQLGISNDNSENISLNMGKSFLHFNKYDNLQEVYHDIDILTADKLLIIANEILAEEKLFSLTYC